MSSAIGLNLTGQTAEGLQQQGLQDFNSFTGTAGGLQENPALMADISESNANLAAAPSPSAAAAYALQLYNQSMNPASGSSSTTFTPQANPYSQFPFQSPSGGTGAGSNYANLVSQHYQPEMSYWET
jgi:hypothetical protein